MPTPTELFKKACEAWEVEISPVVTSSEDFRPRRILSYKGQPLDVSWKPEVVQDLSAFKGVDGEVEIVSAVLYKLLQVLKDK